MLGILIPIKGFHALGIPYEAYHWFAVAAGSLAAVLVMSGVVVLAPGRPRP